MRYVIAALALVILTGCSSPAPKDGVSNNVAVDVGAADLGGADSTSRDTGGSVGGCGPTGMVTPCPIGLVCEYREDPREGCGTIETCDGDSITSEVNDCDPLPPVTCPDTRDAASGELCDTLDAYCDYDGLVCHCTNCVNGPVGTTCDGFLTWMCASPNPDSECPPAKPRLGSACSVEGKACQYGCGETNGRTCTDGAWWASDGGPCPVSTVRVKRDIRYLTQDEVREIAADVQTIPLARWQYTDPSLGRGDKLGFIIEDLPATTPAVDRQRLMVDLYGYTSMLVADAQARERQMQNLEARIAALEQSTRDCAQTPE